MLSKNTYVEVGSRHGGVRRLPASHLANAKLDPRGSTRWIQRQEMGFAALLDANQQQSADMPKIGGLA